MIHLKVLMAYSKAKLKISGDRASPCFKQSSDSKISSNEIECVHCTVQSDPSSYKHRVALFTNFFFIIIHVCIQKIFLTVL
jgi:hypothetical protein